MRPEWFTPATARLALERIRPDAEALRDTYLEMAGRKPSGTVTDQPVDPAYFRLVLALWRHLEALQAQGVRVEDIGAGRLAFPARRAGRPVTLCWCVGADGLLGWRDAGETGGRPRPVDDDGPWEPV